MDSLSFRFRRRAVVFVLLLPLAALAPVHAVEPGAAVELRDGDRVTLLGAAFVERLQNHGYLETLLTAAHPDRHVLFRNLGWSGDTVEGISRAVFGSPQDGFERLVSDVSLTKPTMILICYGDNEAHVGLEGLPTFVAGLSRLLDALEKTGARLVLLSPVEREALGPPLPDPQQYNESLRVYREAIQNTAADRGLTYLELNPLVESKHEPLISNTVHFTPYGHWRAAPAIAERLGVAPTPWSIDIHVHGEQKTSGVDVADVNAARERVTFEAADHRLPLPAPPPYSPEAAAMAGPQRTLTVRGLPPGKYRLLIDGKPQLTAVASEFAEGVRLATGPQFDQAETLRRTIGEKNELFFHRYRPQNETYLFLFRKHEQGNNAVEIPQFDPLIEAKEKEIATLRKPRKHEYEIAPIREIGPP
ncbi:MAG: SGNH/GDSL hydrolase family protein [Planctomycetes bacterium]|nr:SGNH/GDSL hydrolase family protein [Planctomycetota bacterium]